MENKNTFSKLTFILILLFFVNGTFNLFATGYPVINDNANLLSDEEKELLLTDMMPITEYGGVMFVTNDDDYPQNSAEEFAKELCNEQFNGGSGLVFLIDMHDRRIEIFSTGDIYKIIGKNWAEAVTDNVYNYATAEDYYTCAKKAFEQIETILEGGSISVPMRKISLILFSIGFAMLLVYIAVYFSRSKYSFGKKTALVHSKSDQKTKNVSFVSKTKISERTVLHSSGGGGSSGGGSHSGGGGGGSSGGGGGHSF